MPGQSSPSNQVAPPQPLRQIRPSDQFACILDPWKWQKHQCVE
jgi:hypothetical protein